MNVRCEKCGQTYDADPELAGKTVQCQCGENIFVPEIKKGAVRCAESGQMDL